MIVVIRIALIPPPAPNWAKSCQFLVKEAFVRQFLHSSQFFLSIIRIVCANCFEAESTLVLILHFLHVWRIEAEVPTALEQKKL